VTVPAVAVSLGADCNNSSTMAAALCRMAPIEPVDLPHLPEPESSTLANVSVSGITYIAS
jgi:hypothetical protein